MQMLKNILKPGKKYYLELDEKIEDLKESEVVQTAVKTAEKATEAVQEKIAEVAQSEPAKEAGKTATEAAESAKDKVSSASSKAAKKAEKAQESVAKQVKPAKTAEKAQGKAKSNGKTAESTKQESANKPTPANAGASSFDPPFWVAAMNNTNTKNVNSDGQVEEPTFATDNLLPIVTKYRRRPGGSLDKFKNMAKNAKTPRR